MLVVAQKNTPVFIVQHMLSKSNLFFWQAIFSQGVQTIKVCVNKKLPQIKFVF